MSRMSPKQKKQYIKMNKEIATAQRKLTMLIMVKNREMKEWFPNDEKIQKLRSEGR